VSASTMLECQGYGSRSARYLLEKSTF